MPKPHSVTPDRAEAHEGLYLRLAKLLKQTETIASRKPEAEIPAETRALASDLLFEVRPQAGIQAESTDVRARGLDSRLRGNDVS